METKVERQINKKTIKSWDKILTLDNKPQVKGEFGSRDLIAYNPVRYQYESFAELQADIDANLSTLRLKKSYCSITDEGLKKPVLIDIDFVRDRHSNVGEFLQYFFTIYNRECITVNKIGRVTCTEFKRRSLVDLYRICKYYYPTTSIKEVKEALWTLPFGIDVFICPDIKRRVHRRNAPNYGGITYNNADEFGWDYYCTNVKDSKYFNMPYKELVPLINKINNNKASLSPVSMQYIDPNVTWYAGNNYVSKNNTPKPVVQVVESTELPF